MKKRILSLALTVAMLITLIPLGATPARAASSFTPSETMVEVLKTWEGFSATPYWDYKQWTIGYGTKVPDGKLAEYQANGITVEDANAQLMETLNNMSVKVNEFIDKFGLTFTQSQFDAMLSLSFNCGTGWTGEVSTLRTSVIEGWTGSNFLFAMGQWSTAGGVTQNALIRRRLAEANMYLTGTYSATPPENFCYVKFDPMGGECEIKTQGYDSNEPAEIRAVPTYEGYNFEGWYTDRTGGEKVTTLDAGVRNFTLYAHWSAGDGAGLPQDNVQEEITGSPVDYERQIATGVLNAFSSPVKGALVVDAYQINDIVRVVAEYTDSNGIKWGKLQEGGWINLTYTQDPVPVEEGDGVTVTVTATDVNLRRGPGTSYALVGKANKGDQLIITQTSTGGGYTWGKSSKGWIALKYTDYDAVIGGTTTPPENNTTPPENNTTPPATPSVIATGKVKLNSGRLNVRSGAGTGNSVVGSLANGAAVEIYEKTQVGATTWGKISNGWISLDYVALDTAAENGQPTTPPETTPPETAPQQPAPEQKPTTTVTGKVVLTSGHLNVRSGAGTGNPVVGKLSAGAVVTITEKKTVGSTVWGKISNGWISMDYVQLNSDSGSNTQTISGTVNVQEMLRIRTGPSTSYAIAGYLKPRVRVEILERKTVGSTVWGRIDKGWISLDYVILDGQTPAPDNSQSQTVTGTVTLTSGRLNVRSGAGTNNKIVGYLNNGAKVTILETTTVNGTTWGRIEKGWISMDYVK